MHANVNLNGLTWLLTLRNPAACELDIVIVLYLRCNRSVISSLHSVNGDIAIQWEWSNFDPSQNPNPLTDYDKTLHNWLRLRDEHVTQNLCQSAVRERLAKYVKYKASLFLLLFLPRTRLLKQPVHGISREMSQNTRGVVRKCLCGIHTMADNILGFKFPQNRQKWPSISMFERPRTDSGRMTS